MTPAIAFLDGKFTADLPMYVNDAALSLSANASQVLAKRYLRRGPDGELETPAGLFYRVARFVGRADLDHGCTTRITDRTIERFYQLLSTARFLPNTPTFTGAGTPLGQLAACFVLPLADDMGKEPEGIFNTMRDAALIQQTGGGNGFSFGRLRRKGARVATSQGAASGPVSFLEVFDKAFGAVAQGGSRRGANMAVLPCLAGDTEIHTLAGKVAIKDLVGQRPYVYACDTLTRKTHVVQADAVFVSGENRAVVRVWMDNDEYIDCTPDHRFLLRDGTYKEAGSLALGDSLMAFEKAIVQHGNSSRFIATIGATGAHGEYEHRVVARDILGEHVDGNHHVHHIDGNPLNNLPANLMVVSRSEHAKLHNDLLLATQQAIAKRRKGKTLVETYGIEKATAWKQKMAEAKRGRQAIANHRVVKVEPIGVADKVYDITLPAYHNFVANEVFVHNCNHPDILEFIACKAEEGRIANFNISVAVTDAFMFAVREDGPFDLINPEDGSVARTVQARDIYREIVKYAHKNGEPGMLFIDAANASNPVPHIGQYEATNPCGEQWLLPHENCCLGSVNLAKHVGRDTFGDLVVDWAALAATISDAVHFLDNVVTANAYVPAVPKLREAGLRARRIGLGIMGLGDLFYLLGVRYGSEEGQELAGQIMEFVRYHAMARSVTLAVARGTFPAYRGSVYQKDTWRTPEPLVPFSRSYRRPHLDWEFLREQIRTHGIRNAAQTTIAPTGTLSTVADCEGYGCEPVFALGYIRHFKDGDRDVTLPYTSPLFELALGATRLSDERKAAVRAYVAEYGTCQTLSELPLALRNTFVVSADITAEEHVRMQAALQTFVDNSLSKTCNFPAGATEADVDRAYQLAWELGCKGLTVYVTGSRSQVVLETKATQAAKATPDAEPVSLTDAYAQLTITPQGVIIDGENRFNAVLRMANHLVERQRPDKLQGTTYKKQTPLGAAYVTVNVDAEGEPFETFINIGKAGSETAAISEAVGRLISYILRMPSPLAPGARLGEVAQSLMGIGGSRSFGFGAKKVQSLADAIGQVLGSHLIGDHTHDDDAPEGHPVPAAAPSPTIESTTRPAGELCPECGEAALLNTEGCKKCYACNYTEC